MAETTLHLAAATFGEAERPLLETGSGPAALRAATLRSRSGTEGLRLASLEVRAGHLDRAEAEPMAGLIAAERFHAADPAGRLGMAVGLATGAAIVATTAALKLRSASRRVRFHHVGA